MGGAVSSGRDNNELVDNLMSGNYIRSRSVERVFRVLDRADYMSAEARDQAYKDLAWRNGPLHLSAPCIYSEVMEALELKPGLSFLNVGSGTGYLSTLVGLIIGSSGISHGVEAIPVVMEYANKKLGQFIENSITLDEFDFCTPKYYTGNGLCLAPTQTYDRVYCGAGVLSKYESYFKQFTKVGGVLVMPLSDTLVQLRRVSDSHWTKRNLLNVSFALLRDPDKDELEDLIKLEYPSPASLQVLSRGAIRGAMRAGLQRRHPELREPPPPPPPPPRTGPRRICIPYDAASDDELNELHELDEAGGAHEMNALLSLVLSMGQNRAAGSLRLDAVDDVDLDEDYAEVGDLYALDDREVPDGEDPPLLPDDGVIVFDVSQRSMRARHWHPRPQNGDTKAAAAAPAAVEPGTSKAAEAGPAVQKEAVETKAVPETGPSSSRSSGSSSATSPRVERPSVPWSGSSSGDDDEATQVKDSKRQKLDSGIGEGTASSGASPDKSDDKSSASSKSREDDDEEDTDMPWCEEDGESDSSSSGASGCGSGCEGRAPRAAPPATKPDLKRKKLVVPLKARAENKPTEGRRRVHRRGRARGVGDVRRVRLSLAMKRGVKELPLPHALKMYVNYGRTYQL